PSSPTARRRRPCRPAAPEHSTRRDDVAGHGSGRAVEGRRHSGGIAVMKPRSILSVALIVVLLGGAGRAFAADGDSMVRTKSGLDGLGVVNTLCHLLGCQVLGALDTPPGQTSGSSLF